MNYKITRAVITIAFIIILACIPLITNNYYQYIINLIFVNFLVTLGLAIILGYSGQFAFASAGFLGIGAYTAGLSMVHLSISYWPALLLSALVSLVFAVLLGFIGLRLTRYYLSISTMAFTLAMRFFYVNAGVVTFGPSGFNIPFPKLFGFDFNTDKRVYYIVLVVVLVLSVLSRNILRSKIGRAFIAIRDKEEAAAAASINVNQYKMLAFLICGVLGGVAGGLYCIVLGRITPDEFGMNPMLLHFLIVVLGGLGSFLGLIISSIIVTILPEALRAFAEWQEILYGGIIILIILFGPEGLYGLLQKYSPIKWREKMYGNVER
jgi:branched-chain amino acid transport system permease protein